MTATARPKPGRLATRAIELALAGCQHQVLIDPDGRTRILPLGTSLAQADEAALDAEIQGYLGNGDVAH